MSSTAIQASDHATRIDLDLLAGDPIDMLVPILDANADPVEIAEGDIAAWSARSQIRRHSAATRVLHAWTSTGDAPNASIVPGSPAQVRLTATGAETGAWQTDWPEFLAHWDLEVVPPSTPGPQTIASGLVRLRPQFTH